MESAASASKTPFAAMLPDLEALGVSGAQLDHLGIAVRSIDAAKALYSALGLEITHIETIADEGVRVAMLPLGTTRIELLEPTADDSPVGRFLARRGEGLHHIAFAIQDLEATAARLTASGIRLVNNTIQTGVGGHRYLFIHPSSAGGVLVELVESQAAESESE